MRRLAIQTVVLVVALSSVAAAAGTIYRYHDPKAKRDVFVSALDQVPAAFREHAQLVVSDGVLVDSTHKAASDSPTGTVIYGDRKPAGWWEAISQIGHQAMQTPGRIDWRRGLSTAVDTDLVRRGVRPLSADETQQGLNLAARIGWILLAVGSLALAGLIVMMIQAWVANQHGWTLGILLCQPLSLLYALKFADGKSRWWRVIMALLQMAPHAVLVTGGLWLHAWFTAVLRARGLG
jgi:hypothetical protein